MLSYLVLTGALTLCRGERAGVTRVLRSLDCLAVLEVVVIRLIGDCDCADSANSMTLKFLSE